MDVTDNNPCPMSSRLPEGGAVPPSVWEEEHPYAPIEAGERPQLSSRPMCQSVRRLGYASEVREAKIRELQDAIKNGTYYVPAGQIADKMLRNLLRGDLP